MSQLIKLYPENPREDLLDCIVEVLKKGGLIIYPTDTVYGLGCDITNTRAMERLARIKNVKLQKAQFSFICNDLSHLSSYVKPVSSTIFKLLKRATPGPFTFILPAAYHLPHAFKNRKTVGIRIPDHRIPREIVAKLGHPIASTSVHDEDDLVEYTVDPELIAEKYDRLVDIVIDGGYGSNKASTVIDLNEDEIVVLREGKGNPESIL